MTKRPLLITEHAIITISRTDKTVLGQIRHRQGTGRSKADHWEITTGSGVWVGPYASQDDAEASLREGA